MSAMRLQDLFYSCLNIFVV